MCESALTSFNLNDMVGMMYLKSPTEGTGKYPLNKHCEVTLTNAQMKEVSIEFLTFAVEYQSQCNWDYVQMTIRGDFVRKLCGLDKPKSIKTTSDQIDVIFHSDYVVPADGFVIKIYALPKTTPSAVSTFTNKNLPSMSSTPQLGEPATAVTQSMSPSTTTKSLESTSVFTPQTSSVAMASDALSLLSQKTTSTSTSLSSTSSSKAHYYSTSDTSSSQTSSVTSVETAKPTSFNPTSPSVTQQYDSSTDETSLADKTSSIKNISEGATVSTKRNPDAPPFTTPGNPDVPPLTTPGNQDVPPLAEKTTGTSTKTPGKIVDICHYSHLQIQDSLFLVSPGYTEKQAYPLNTECNVEIVPPPHKEVKLSISDFELELNQECTWDYLTLEQSNIAVRFCGWLDKGHSIGSYDACAPSYIRTVNDKNKRMVCLLNTKTDLKLNEALPIRLKFFSDGFITRRGFNISVELSDATVQTPINGSPSSTQSHTIQQNYTTTSQNTSSNIAVSSISVSAYAKSSYTSLKPISTAKSTATSIPTVKTYVNNQTTIFVTGIESKTPGTGSLTSPVENTATNTLTTDNAPSASTSSTYTEMSKSDSTAEPSTTASVSSRSTSVKPTTVQTTILSTLLKASSTVSFSVSALPQSVPTHSTASVTLPSSMSSTNPISASGNSCSEFEHALVLKESAGIITSPEFKNSKTYAPNSNCSWIISAGANKMIAIVFEHFDIEFDSHCKYDRLTVYRLGLDGVPAEQLAVLCGSNLPPSLHATGEVLVSFQSDGIVQKSGFQLRYLKTSVTSGGVCPGGRTGCGDGGECIPMEWWCDGTTDCANMADENDCPTCSTGEFSCSDGKCLPNSHRCDGISQCAFNEDETGCVTLSDDTHGTLAVNIAGEDHSVCYDVTVQTGSDLLCKKLGYRHSESVLPIKQSDKQQKYARLTLTGTEIVFEKRASCANDMSTLIVCMDSGCGQKADKHRKKRVVGGSVSSTGQWPWIIGLRVGPGIVNCGGTIISRHWVLTAGHCVKDFLFSPQELSIVAGSHDLSDVTGQVRHVAEVIIHPDYNFIYSDDIALLRLQRPLDFSDDVNAACLPWDGRQFSPSSNCYVVGYGVWNVENYYTTLAPRYLRHVRTKIVHSDMCTELYSYKTYIKDTMMCAGYTGGGMDACKGDSGSGLLCETEAGRWMVAGVVSWGDMCGNTNRPGVYTRVTSFLEWIDGHTSVQVNNNSVNCSFEAGWCGYTDSSQGSYFWTRGPWDKYTNGMVLQAVKPSYVKSKSTSAVLESPEFIQSTNSCLKFSFKLSGNSNITLSVFGVIDGNDVNEGVIHKRLLWRVITHYSSSKMWTPTEVDVGSDVRRLHFTSSYDEGNVYSMGLDNVTIVPGPCLGKRCTRM
ncbi:cubilin-like [Dreissena polymorpha]|uniref:cubilin-like n=1 Tax=Dreissena polymorpha TaxID=45954 RepID=UPI0022654C31|nr:cubilin-like [Dreissena polymorpha]